MPVNMRTHGHGQGYADISFLIPELIQSMRIRKGPYFADEGDFSSAGAIHIDYIDTMNPGLGREPLGMFGYGRALGIKSVAAGAGNLLVAGEGTVYDGPWDVPDRMKKINGVVRYSQGTALDGFSITGMAYNNRWTSTDQVAKRAIDQGLIGRFGTLDPTDGGRSSRYSLSSRFSTLNDWGVTKIEAYAIRYTMTLFNNFTYFLDNEVDGDQFSQTDSRTILGFHGNHTFKGRLGPFDSETRIGVQGRYDDIAVGLHNTVQRQLLSTVRADDVKEGSIALYAQNTTHWTDWMRTVAGGRGDWYRAKVVSDNPLNSGNASDFIASPKFSLIFGPFQRTEFFVNAGYGFHSNDVRGVTITVDPATGLPADKVPLLVRSKGAEVGVTTKVIPGLESSLALFVLDYASELLFVGDAGTTEASRPSRRVGVEWTNHYKPLPWLGFDLDVADDARPLHRFRSGGRLHPGLAEHGRERRRGGRQGDRLVRRRQAALFRAAAADRGQQRALVADHAGERARRLPLRERHAAAARRLQPVQRQGEPDRVLLRVPALQRTLRRRDLRPPYPSGRAAGAPPDAGRPALYGCAQIGCGKFAITANQRPRPRCGRPHSAGHYG